MARLSVLICTAGDRIARVPEVILPADDLLSYVVAWQHMELPVGQTLSRLPQLKRADVSVIPVEGKGLSRNRNVALSHCHTEFALIADDDVRLSLSELKAAVAAMDKRQETGIFCFQMLSYSGLPVKKYAAHEFSYESRPYGTYFSSCEIVVRMSDRLPEFDTRFGLGSEKLVAGEEEVFLHDASVLGRQIRYLPMPICRTEAETTGSKLKGSPRFMMTKGAVLCHLHGASGALLRSLKYACTHFRQSPRGSFWNMIRGIIYYRKTARRCTKP